MPQILNPITRGQLNQVLKLWGLKIIRYGSPVHEPMIMLIDCSNGMEPFRIRFWGSEISLDLYLISSGHFQLLWRSLIRLWIFLRILGLWLWRIKEISSNYYTSTRCRQWSTRVIRWNLERKETLYPSLSRICKYWNFLPQSINYRISITDSGKDIICPKVRVCCAWPRSWWWRTICTIGLGRIRCMWTWLCICDQNTNGPKTTNFTLT